MKSYIDWLKEDGFFVSSTWDVEKKDWLGPGKMVVFPIIEDVLGHALTPDENDRLPYVTIIYSTPKKSGKSIIAASILAWALDEYPPNTQLFALANDLDQAEGIIFQDLAYHIRNKYGIEAKNHRIDMPNGSHVQALAHHYRTAAGSRHTITVWDELWAFQRESSRRLWAEMTPIPTVRNPLRLIVTYAGFSQDQSPLRDMYRKVVDNGEPVEDLKHVTDRNGYPVCFVDMPSRTFAMWHTDPMMPWQTQEYYAEQAASLKPEEFLRLHRNQWVSSKEMFIDPEWWDKLVCLDGPIHLVKDHPGEGKPVIVAVDAGLKKDTSVVVGVYYDPETRHIGLAFHKIWTPIKGETLDLETTVEEYLLEMSRIYTIIEVAFDPSQLLRSMGAMRKKGLRTFEYTQNAGNLLEMTNILYDLIKHRLLDIYEDDELKSHVVSAVIKNTTRGIQLTKNPALTTDPSDAAVAVAMAVTRAIFHGAVMPEGDIEMDMPFSDEENPFEPWEREILRKIPEPLRPVEFLEDTWLDKDQW
jgi:phage terminase large subunit-like protein